jgi:type I restriction enzyme S subunit
MSERELSSVAVPRGLVGGPFGSNLVNMDYTDTGVPVIRGANMSGQFIGGDFVFVSLEKVERDLSRNTAEPGDLIFTQRGTLGQVSLVPPSPFPKYVISQSQMRLRVNPDIADSRFIYYACRLPGFIQQIHNHAVATGVPHINLGTLGQLTVPDLLLPEQRSIAEVLGALDDKIAANAAVVEKADALAAATYETVASEYVPLSSLARFVNGKAFTKGASGTGRVVIRIAELNSGLGGSTVYNDIEVADDHVARPGDLLFAWSGSLTAARWFRAEAIVNQHIFKVVADCGWPLWLVNQAVRSKLTEFKAIAADKATTMGHIQRRHLDQPVAIPSPEDVERIDGIMTGLWDTALAAELERERLAATRDELLPLLMSGRITVRDAEEVAEAAT